VTPDALRCWQVIATFRLAVVALTAAGAFCEGEPDWAAALPSRVAAQVVGTATDPTAPEVPRSRDASHAG
jgi:hypothetical protein